MKAITIPVKYIDTTKYKVTISYDDSPHDAPWEWTTPDERGVTYALKVRDYSLPFEIDNANDLDEYANWDEFAKSNAPSNQQCYRFVRWYEHSGIAVSLRDDEGGRDWDAGIAGVIFGETTDAINSEFTAFKEYIEGSIYVVTIKTEDGRDIDSLAGIYGDDGVQEYIKEIIGDALPENIETIYE